MPAKRKYHGREEFARVWSHATRQVHLLLLSTPPHRKLEPDPNPKFYRSYPMKIEKATLNHQASKRIKLLSQVPPGKFTEKFVTSIPAEHFVNEYNLSYNPTDRIMELSKPKMFFKKKEKKRSKSKKSQRKQGQKKGQKAKKPVTTRTVWLELRAAPRPVPLPSPIPKIERRTAPLSKTERAMRIQELAHPMPRYLIKPDPWDPYEVSKKAQKAITTGRILKLANPRELPEDAILDLEFKPFTIKKNALKYKVTKRVKELAEPIVRRKAADTDVKENAFSVPKRALKAMCSKRTKELAKPISRKGAD